MSMILHSDLNCFYASVEMNECPSLRGKPIAVCGSTEDRHGIVLTASYPAKRMGVKTGSANWEAKQVCPGLICVEPHYDLYMKYSRLVRSIYSRYSDDIEPFGMDENWISIPFGRDIEKDGRMLADEIRNTVREETGLTVSVGVSFSKIFAKLGSDMKKPDAVTVITQENYKDKVWPLPASDLLYVGRATTKKLAMLNILTIGDLANSDPALLNAHLGKNGLSLWQFANALDGARVKPSEFIAPIKSVGHGTTCVSDLETGYEVWRVLYELAQDVGMRLRENKLSAQGVQISVKDNELNMINPQVRLPVPTQNALDIAIAGYSLFKQRYNWLRPIRALTIRGIDLIPSMHPVQLDMFCDHEKRERQHDLDVAVDEIRRRFGYNAICAASLLGDKKMAQDKCETVIMPGMMYA